MIAEGSQATWKLTWLGTVLQWVLTDWKMDADKWHVVRETELFVCLLFRLISSQTSSGRFSSSFFCCRSGSLLDPLLSIWSSASCTNNKYCMLFPNTTSPPFFLASGLWLCSWVSYRSCLKLVVLLWSDKLSIKNAVEDNKAPRACFYLAADASMSFSLCASLLFFTFSSWMFLFFPPLLSDALLSPLSDVLMRH